MKKVNCTYVNFGTKFETSYKVRCLKMHYVLKLTFITQPMLCAYVKLNAIPCEIEIDKTTA